MSYNFPLICRSSSILLIFSMYGKGGHKLEVNILPQEIFENSKGELIIEGGVMSSEHGTIPGSWWTSLLQKNVMPPHLCLPG